MWAGLSIQSPSLSYVYYNKCSICDRYSEYLIDRNFNRNQREYKFFEHMFNMQYFIREWIFKIIIFSVLF